MKRETAQQLRKTHPKLHMSEGREYPSDEYTLHHDEMLAERSEKRKEEGSALWSCVARTPAVHVQHFLRMGEHSCQSEIRYHAVVVPDSVTACRGRAIENLPEGELVHLESGSS